MRLEEKNRAKEIPECKIIYYQEELYNGNEGDTGLLINYIPSKENVEDNVLSEIIFSEFEKELTSVEKQIFDLFREGYKQKEISKMIGCSQANVSRAKKKLVDYLAK